MMPYKNAIFSLLLLAAVAAGLCACAADSGAAAADGTGTEEADASGVRYLSLRVSNSDSATPRAVDSATTPEYKDGSEFEHALDFTGGSENVIIFIDKGWTYKGYSLLEYDGRSLQDIDKGTFPAEAAYIGLLRPSDNGVVYNLPEYGMAVLNAHGITEALDRLPTNGGASIEDILALVDSGDGSHTAGRSGNYFTMTSTAYLVKEKEEWRHSVVFAIDKSKVFDSKTEARISPAATAIVERMSAKFSLKMPGATGGTGVNFRPDGGRAQVIVCNYVDGQPNYNNRTWTCAVTAWGINKYEPASYYFRNIVGDDSADKEGSVNKDVYPYTYGANIDTDNNPFFNGWNYAAHHRAFWAVDPNYSGGTYPSQYRAAVDNTEVNYYGKDGRQPSLNYISYNELSSDFSALNSTDGCTLYSSENTFPDTRLGGHWQHDLAGCEVVIGARIHIAGINEQSRDYDLYRNRIGVFYPSATDFAAYFISTINTQLASQSTMTYRYYDWATPSNNSATDDLRTFSVSKSGYKLYYGGKPLTAEVMASLSRRTIPATIENGDGKVIPWVDGMYIGRRNTDPNTYEEVGEVEPLYIGTNELKSLIYDWIGPFDHFSGGRMVYSVPVRYRAAADKDVTAGNYRPTVGDYGVVRNSWYRIVIDAINSLGTPVDDPAQKIIPYQASLENSILMQIKVLDWHKFETDVTLPDKIK